MTTTWIIGDLLTGARIQTLPVMAGLWSDLLNGSGTIQCTVDLNDPDVQRLRLAESARPGRTFLAAVSGDTVLQAGPVWRHSVSEELNTLSIFGAGMYSYFDRRVLLPVLAPDQLPSDPATDTNFANHSLQAIAVAIVQQALSWPSGNVPVITPTPLPGNNERNYRGADVAPVGERLRQLTGVRDGPDIRFVPRWTTDRLAVEWVMQVGTPTEPLLFSPQEPVFNVGLEESSVSDVSVSIDGANIGSQGFASGGRAIEEALVARAFDPRLTSEGFPLLDLVDSSHATVKEFPTLQGYANELVLRSRTPIESWSFTHQTDQRPFLTGFNVGDFAKVRIYNSPYFPDGERRLRITSRSGDAVGDTVSLTLQPEVL